MSRFALIIAESNGCNHCLSAHTAIGKMVGLDETAISASRHGKGTSDRASAALKFVTELLNLQGRVSEAQVNAVRDAGFIDGEIAI